MENVRVYTRENGMSSQGINKKEFTAKNNRDKFKKLDKDKILKIFSEECKLCK